MSSLHVTAGILFISSKYSSKALPTDLTIPNTFSVFAEFDIFDFDVAFLSLIDEPDEDPGGSIEAEIPFHRSWFNAGSQKLNKRLLRFLIY